jgi:hypothetical protein
MLLDRDLALHHHSPAESEKIALPRIAVAARPGSGWWLERPYRNHSAIGTCSDTTVNKLDLHGCARGNRGCSVQGLSRRIAHQRKSTRQHAPVGECRQQLPVALAARELAANKALHSAIRP